MSQAQCVVVATGKLYRGEIIWRLAFDLYVVFDRQGMRHDFGSEAEARALVDGA